MEISQLCKSDTDFQQDPVSKTENWQIPGIAITLTFFLWRCHSSYAVMHPYKSQWHTRYSSQFEHIIIGLERPLLYRHLSLLVQDCSCLILLSVSFDWFGVGVVTACGLCSWSWGSDNDGGSFYKNRSACLCVFMYLCTCVFVYFSWQQVGLGGIDSDGGILSKNSWRGPQLQITPSYSCLSSTRGGGGLGLAGTRAFDALSSYIGVQLRWFSLGSFNIWILERIWDNSLTEKNFFFSCLPLLLSTLWCDVKKNQSWFVDVWIWKALLWIQYFVSWRNTLPFFRSTAFLFTEKLK